MFELLPYHTLLVLQEKSRSSKSGFTLILCDEQKTLHLNLILNNPKIIQQNFVKWARLTHCTINEPAVDQTFTPNKTIAFWPCRNRPKWIKYTYKRNSVRQGCLKCQYQKLAATSNEKRSHDVILPGQSIKQKKRGLCSVIPSHLKNCHLIYSSTYLHTEAMFGQTKG